MVGHRFLPERRLTIDSFREGANFFPVESGNGVPVDFRWIDQAHFQYACEFPPVPVMQGCGLGYMLAADLDSSHGIDLSRFKTLNLSVRYTGKAQYLRVAIRNFDPSFSKLDDLNSPKFNFVNLPTRDLSQPIAIGLGEFAVAEWWTTAYNLPRKFSRPDLSNATVLNFDLQGELAGSRHEIRIDKVEFVGDWISTEYWYLGILCVWMILGTVYGTSQWLRLRRAHRAQRRQIAELAQEKEKYEKLSTIDALTGVLNRHGTDQFIAALAVTRMSASVVVIDLDHFKRINDQRGHHVGDRVLRTMGEILRAGSRNTDAVGRWGVRSSCWSARARISRKPRISRKSCAGRSWIPTSFRKSRSPSPPASAWRVRRTARISKMHSARRIRRCIWRRVAAETASWPRMKSKCTR